MTLSTTAATKPAQPSPGAALLWWVVTALAGFACLFVTLAAPHLLGVVIKAGDTAPTAILATRSATIVDEEATRRARDQARQSVLPVFRRDPGIDRRILDRLAAELAEVTVMQRGGKIPLPASLGLTAEEQVFLIDAPERYWAHIRASVAPRPAQPPLAGRLQAVPAQGPLENVRPDIEERIINKLRRHQAGRARAPAADPLASVEAARRLYGDCRADARGEILFLAVAIKPQDWPFRAVVIRSATGRLLKLGPLFPGIPRSDWERAMLEFLPDRWDDTVRWAAARLAAHVIEPNVVVDAEATKAKLDAAAAAVKPYTMEVRSGQVIVARGAVITPQTAAVLKELGITRFTNWPLVAGLALSLVAACTFFGIFLHTYAPKHLFSPASLGLLFTVSVVTCAAAAFVGRDFPQFVPLPAATLIATIFFGSRVSTGLLLVLIVFLKADDLVDTTNLVALSAASTIAIGANIKRRNDLMVRGCLIGVLQAGGFLVANSLSHEIAGAAAVMRELAVQALGGLSSCIVAIGSLPFLENIFGMVTPFRVTELTDADQPLLRQLEENAPGTYQHSLAVANLAEAGARAIGADTNLVRAGSLYHDIGKMVRPRYFIENQLGDTNPHDAMTPEESRDRVLAHVTDGMALARKYGLPKAVRDFIPQHQGTTLMAYFYHKACLRDGADNVDPDFYRYGGPRPQSKEAAVVMLADVSEAVTHSMSDPTQEEVEGAIGSVLKARWDDGQLAESGMTRDELERVKKAFARVWRTLHHERLKYPSTTTGRMPVPPEPPPSQKLGQSK